MTRYDVFNGDADGIASLVQLRLDAPEPSQFVTGMKRDIALLDRVPGAPGDAVTVLDLSLAVNRAALDRLLDRGVTVAYFDHHYAGDVPAHPGLVAHLDPAPGVCTGMLVDRHLRGRQRVWTVVAAFGDNLLAAARKLAEPLRLDDMQLAVLRDLADNLTYNSYSDDPADVIVPPAELAGTLLRARDPFAFVAGDPVYAAIDGARRRDIAQARATRPALTLPSARVYLLADAPWTRRVRGIFGNEIANAEPDLAHAVLTVDGDGYRVSVRAPRARPTGADALCREFPGGNGRAAAAGIDHLPRERFHEFVERLAAAFR